MHTPTQPQPGTLPRTVAVAGLGTAGSALARRCAAAGLRTLGIEADPAAASRARHRLAGTGVEVTHDLATVAVADAVIEAVPEHAHTKRAVLKALAEHRATRAPALTTALTLTAAELAHATGTPELGLTAVRFLRADPLTAVEVATAPHTPDQHLSTALALLHHLGLTTHRTPDLPGGIAPALVFAFLNQAAWMHADRYAGRAALDTAVRLGCGWPDGPLRTLDAIGVDTALAVLEGLHRRLGPRFAPPPGLRRMAAAGALGTKAGRGYYKGGEPRTEDDGRGRGPGQGHAHRDGHGYDHDEDGAARKPPHPSPATAVIVGSGTMATGIAEVFLRGGYCTVLLARTPQKAAAATEAVEFALLRTAADGPDPAAALARWTATADRTALTRADVVVEAIAEDLTAKRELFAELGTVCRPGTLLATTTSSLPVRECAAASGRPADVLGLHFFNPAPAMPLVELVRTPATGDSALATARTVLARLGRTPVDCTDRTGFLVNALLFPYLNDALRLLADSTVSPALLDATLKSVGGQPVGPTRLLDTVGTDVALTVTRHLYEASGRRPEFAPAPLLEQLVAHGHLGRKTPGRGVRTYLTTRPGPATAA
ncbi:3-hydroxyacyl-CoA dehydrogenase family protein [Streptomyces sp. GS7]|uniref:3-hydroxyacyl-CoA dehydrogenase family protein n=1 Tax=Streptomyces sp. GS7 TaxID=2692234 RepID=UPI0013186D8E|nr:3-hydroxyacyl-CoA dehydrogenase NAD-binding domain-containing protein [Streptomyces sp. GS7]QHC22577.1 3-hydroxyacyl-CoA dehydrogenase family protein [Streptomyces sp. GS7]